MPVRFTLLSLFPGMFESYLAESMLKRAGDRGLILIDRVNIRDFARDKHRVVDDTPFGGGGGMVLKPEPVAEAIERVRAGRGPAHVVLLTPRGRLFKQEDARRLSSHEHLVLVCGRYEGVDERISRNWVDEELSIGDYVLCGGELPAMVVMESVARWIPGVLGAEDGVRNDSFSRGLLEHPQYTRPREFRGEKVPDVLLEGDHAKIEAWRRKESLLRTARVRPDLIEPSRLEEGDVAFLREQGYEIKLRGKGRKPRKRRKSV